MTNQKSAMPSSPLNRPSENAPFFIPANPIPPGAAVQLSASTPTLFRPLTIRGATFHNRIWVAPMCQYSTASSPPTWGALTPYHVVTLGHYALKGASLVFVEATAVTPNGRISPNDSGLWDDSQIEGLRRVCEFIHSVGGKVGIQLAHAGRKASTVAPWLGRERGKSVVADESVGGWPDNVVGASPIAWSKEGYYKPKEMTLDDIQEVVGAFAAAAKRAIKAGVDVIEIHGAHGYLISSFNSPISNQRTDAYGGPFENRIRIGADIAKAIRAVIPHSMPLFYRVTSTEWMDGTEEAKKFGSWDVDQSIEFAKLLPAAGVDLLDVSSGGNHEKQRIMPHTGYQIEIAGRIRKEITSAKLPLLIGAVGMITEAESARDIVQGSDSSEIYTLETAANELSEQEEATKAKEMVEGKAAIADVILVARQFMREPEWVLRVAWRLGVDVQWPVQFGRGKFLSGSRI